MKILPFQIRYMKVMNFSISNSSNFPIILWLAPDILFGSKNKHMSSVSLLALKDIFSLAGTSNQQMTFNTSLVSGQSEEHVIGRNTINGNTSSGSHGQEAGRGLARDFHHFLSSVPQGLAGERGEQGPPGPTGFQVRAGSVVESLSTDYTLF